MANWVDDEIYFNYPEGARSKNAFFPPKLGAPEFILPKRRYLYKRSDKKYPDQFWGEVVAYQIGGLLGVHVPPAYAAFNSVAGDCGALIEWFYEDGKAEFIPGGQYMQRIMPEFDRKRGELHNFHSVTTLCRLLSLFKSMTEPWEQTWADTFMFDALIGNTDRHQDNWGCLSITRKNHPPILTLAPLFDNGTSLGHERFPKHLLTWTDAKYAQYVTKGTHHIKWAKEDVRNCGHVQLLQKMVAEYPSVLPSLKEKIDNFDVGALTTSLNHLCELPLSIPLTQDRKNLYIKLLKIRKINIQLALE